MTLVEKLNNYSSDYWDFSDYREKNPVIQYPAKMVTPMQRQIISDILEFDSDIYNVLDPFVGSGTVLDICRDFGIYAIGYDINPLAILITRVRLEGIPANSIVKSIDQLYARINLLLGNVPQHTFCNIRKWFRDDIIDSLSLIRASIIHEKDIRIRRFYWCCLTPVIKKYSNTRTSTFKLHIKEENTIASMNNDCIDEFMNCVSSHYLDYCYDNNDFELKTDDSYKLLSRCKDNSVDLICTSPPYGDNLTTVTYGQYSILPLLWIDNNDLNPFAPELLNKFTAIDRESLGGRTKQVANLNKYIDFLSGINKEKQKKVISFFDDYELVFAQMARVLKRDKLLVLTLGNRRVDNKVLEFDRYNDFLARKYSLAVETTLSRNIVGKRMPLKVSYIASQGSVESMSKEYIKIYKKM